MEAAKDLLKRAVDLESAQKYSEALICYEEGVQHLLRVIGGCQSEVAKKEVRRKAEEYLGRAEQLKKMLKDSEAPEERVRYIHIKEGEVGYSYGKLFEGCLDGNVEWVEVEDPYIRARHQVHNFVRLCEVILKGCKNLRQIQLTTGSGEESSQVTPLRELQGSLQEHGVLLEVTYSSTLHDREIRFSNGWIVKVGRGLDYFQKPKGQFTIGYNDFDMRPCHETTVEIFHRLNIKKLKSAQR